MSTISRIGMIGLDTSHVTIFAKILNDPQDPYHVPGGRVTVGFAGGSSDFELSRSRVGKFTTELKDSWGVKIVDTIEAVAENADLVFSRSSSTSRWRFPWRIRLICSTRRRRRACRL
jgi:hypothetical protein